MTASEKFTGYNTKWFKNVLKFGEIGITYNSQKINKLDNRGYPCMFIGYTEDHASIKPFSCHLILSGYINYSINI
jgi:hypothetical protein